MTDVRAWLSPEARFVCDIAAASLTGDRISASEMLDWPVVAEVLRDHRLELAVSRRIAETPGVPATVAALLHRRAKNGTFQAMERLAATIRVVRNLEQAGIETLAFKGCVLSQQLYADPFRRVSTDIDLLVRPQARMAAAAVLQDLGYRALSPTPVWLDDGAELCFAPCQGKGPIIDLHVRLAHHEAQCPLRILQPFDNAVKVSIGGSVLRTLSPGVGLAYLALHATKHFCRKLGWLHDVAAAARAWPEAWPEALALSQRIGAERRLALITVLTRQLFAAPAPPDMVSQVPAARLLTLAPVFSGPAPVDDAETTRRVGLWRGIWWDLRLSSSWGAMWGAVAPRLRPRDVDISDAPACRHLKLFWIAKKILRVLFGGFNKKNTPQN